MDRDEKYIRPDDHYKLLLAGTSAAIIAGHNLQALTHDHVGRTSIWKSSSRLMEQTHQTDLLVN